ncbi:MAG: acylneuraminate cytidylyltransferase family protein [Muribaculaceae bacterium]|nr:acylneuraminate cytidylyltransferase family protein [Muribaculaceae bacterium]
MKTLYLITARGGSKGIPGKNIRPFLGKPLICHAIDNARDAGANDADILVSTDSEDIRKVAEDYGLKVPFMRPANLATDTASSYDVIVDCLRRLAAEGYNYDRVVLLQPTSPLRTADDIRHAEALWRPDIDMVVSVCPAKTNPYYGAFETDVEGLLHISKGDGRYTRRQDAPEVWEYNGAVYVMTVASLLRGPMSDFRRIVPSVMPSERSVDLDTPLDWEIAEHIAKHLLH